ncbi:N-terminal domain of NEFA-interacting nuclear protein NIP30-domain-containing protein [Usnea florida]
MSSGFVSGGTSDAPIQRDDEWLKAQQDIEANRRRREEESRHEGGKTLYEVLQANKAAKEEAFQESIKLRNQFRNLDEDEVEFLDSVLESTRKKEEEVKKETSEQLDLFRRQQEDKDKELLEGGEKLDGKDGSPTGGESQSPWAVNARKRKRAKENEKAGLRGLKLRKSSSTGEAPVELGKSSLTSKAPDISNTEVDEDSVGELKTTATKIPSTKEKTTTKVSPSRPSERFTTQTHREQDKSSGLKAAFSPGLGLAGYSSDDED